MKRESVFTGGITVSMDKKMQKAVDGSDMATISRAYEAARQFIATATAWCLTGNAQKWAPGEPDETTINVRELIKSDLTPLEDMIKDAEYWKFFDNTSPKSLELAERLQKCTKIQFVISITDETVKPYFDFACYVEMNMYMGEEIFYRFEQAYNADASSCPYMETIYT